MLALRRIGGVACQLLFLEEDNDDSTLVFFFQLPFLNWVLSRLKRLSFSTDTTHFPLHNSVFNFFSPAQEVPPVRAVLSPELLPEEGIGLCVVIGDRSFVVRI